MQEIMNRAIQLMLERYQCHSLQEYDQALREIMQEVALVGLWRGKFFEHAAFYGGTALRIFYHLDRFSEDLDFTLLTSNPHWSWHPFCEALKNELYSFGFEVSFESREKSHQTAIKSAFLKTTTVHELIKIGVHSSFLKGVHPLTMIRVKVEIDTDPPLRFDTEQKFLSQPVPVSIRCVNEEGLFAGKMNAAFFRTWKGRVKGRDWYDVVWLIRQKIPLNLTLFSQLCGQEVFTRAAFQKMARERIDQLNVPAAIEDIIHFVRDQDAIQRTWSKEFFQYWFDQIQF
jgi:predicted nucleotidyltransferase component of viral defense system